MARAKKTSGGRKRRRDAPLISRAMALRVSAGFLWMGLLAGVVYGFTRLEDYVLNDPQSPSIAAASIEWVNAPAWTQAGAFAKVLPQIEQRLRWHDDGTYTINEVHVWKWEDLCRRVHDAVSASPFVAHVDQVTKRSDNVIRVYATFREPATYVIDRRGLMYLVSRDGVQLTGGKSAAYLDRTRWLPITGVDTPPPGVGETWTGPDLKAALTLAQVLQAAERDGNLPYRGQLRAIDVSGFRPLADGPLRLATTGPTEILWGRTPGKEVGLDATAGQKLVALQALFEQHGQLSGGGPVIDVSDTKRVLIRDSSR